MSIFTGVVMAIVGTTQLATFLVFVWLSYLGTICFYRAFTIDLPRGRARIRRYARLVFFLPSTIYWTADSSKEAIMTVSLGLVALGCAKVLVRAPGGFRIATLGLAAGALIRPNELMVILGGFAVALMVRPQGERERMGTVKRIGGLLFMGVLLGISVFLTVHYLRLGNATSGKFSLQATNQNNNETGTGFGSSGFVYSSSLAKWPIDLYEVLFNPLPFNAHGTSEYLAAIENTVIVAVIIASYRQLRILPRTAFARPYVMMCLVYSAASSTPSPRSGTSGSSTGSGSCSCRSSWSSSPSRGPRRADRRSTSGSTGARTVRGSGRPWPSGSGCSRR